MARANNSTRYWCAITIWAVGVALLFALSCWALASFRHDAENRLINEAGRTAAQIASLLALPGEHLNESNAKAVAMAAMEDENLYAVKIENRNGFLAGQRRNYLWEPINWDDEIAENCVQGINPIRVGGRTEGMVEVWLSPRLNAEEATLLEKRELWRFLLIFLVWTAALALLFWHWGEFRRWHKAWLERGPEHHGDNAEGVIQGLTKATVPENADGIPLINDGAGREFQSKNPDSWLVTAGMFRQTFGRGPNLISRLYAEGEIAGLCHLGRVLEQAAPCIGAAPLAEAAAGMQAALNDPDCATRALAVEDCSRILEQTLAALGGQRQTAPGG